MMKKILLLLFIVIPSFFLTGCPNNGGENPVTLEEKYGEEVIAMFEDQTAIPEWQKYLRRANHVRTIYENTSVEEIERRVEEYKEKIKNLNPKNYTEARFFFKEAKELLEDVLRQQNKGLEIIEARGAVRSLYHLPPHPKGKEGMVELIDEMLVIVYARQGKITWDEIRVAMLKEKLFYLPHERRILAQAGL